MVAGNALLLISLNGPQLGTLEAKELIKHTARIYGERKQYKKAPGIKQKEQETQTASIHTQVTLCVESEFMENVEEYLDAIIAIFCNHLQFYSSLYLAF